MSSQGFSDNSKAQNHELLFHRRDAEVAEKLFVILFFADPGGIGFAFHRAGTLKSKIHSSAMGGFPQIDVLFYNCLVWAFVAAASAAEWFSIAVLLAP